MAAIEATQSVGGAVAVRGKNGEDGSGGKGRNGGGGWQEAAGGGRVPQRAYVTGMSMGLGAVLMFFVALVSAYIVRKGMPGSGWVALPALPRILWLNTLVLIASSGALVRARKRFRSGDEVGFRRWWKAATICGVLFLAGQIVAWKELAASGVYLATNASSSFFYLFTAAHGLHLAGGIVALVWVLARPAGPLSPRTATEVAAMYWHSMDVLWVFLFSLLMLAR